MLDPRDRRDLASLGLMVLVYGLAVAPVVHAVVGHGARGHGHVHARAAHTGEEHDTPGERGHEHGPGEGPGKKHGPDGHRHLAGSVEHLLAVAATWSVVLPPRVRWVSWRVERQRGPESLPGRPLRPTAMPQGP